MDKIVNTKGTKDTQSPLRIFFKFLVGLNLLGVNLTAVICGSRGAGEGSMQTGITAAGRSPLAPHPIPIPIEPVRIWRQHREILELWNILAA